MGLNLAGITPISEDNSSNGGSSTIPIKTTVPIESYVEEINRGGQISLNVSKGLSLDLTKQAPTLRRAKIGLGWDSSVNGQAIDLDVFALALHNGKVKSANDIVYYNQLDVVEGIRLSGDNRDGERDGDDEFIIVELDKISDDITSIAIFVNIYAPKINFGMVKNAYVRLVDDEKDKEEFIYLLNEKSGLYQTVHFANLVRNSFGWSFETIGQGTSGDVNEIANKYY